MLEIARFGWHTLDAAARASGTLSSRPRTERECRGPDVAEPRQGSRATARASLLASSQAKPSVDRKDHTGDEAVLDQRHDRLRHVLGSSVAPDRGALREVGERR